MKIIFHHPGPFMKKIVSIVLVFVFFYSFIGFYLNFEIEQCRIKEEIKEKIIGNADERELTLLKISTRDQGRIKWTEEGKEFRYEGEMFDVVKVKTGTDTTCYYCFCDSKENKLLSHLDKLVKQQSDRSPSRTMQKKLVINLYFQQDFLSQIIHESPVRYLTIISDYHFADPEILTPPPQHLQS